MPQLQSGGSAPYRRSWSTSAVSLRSSDGGGDTVTIPSTISTLLPSGASVSSQTRTISSQPVPPGAPDSAASALMAVSNRSSPIPACRTGPAEVHRSRSPERGNPRSGNALQHHRRTREVRPRRPDVVGTLDRLEGVLEAFRGVGVQGQQGLARRHRVAGLGVEFHARARLDRVLLAGTPRAEAPGGDADAVGVEAGQDARGRRLDHVLL